MARFGRQFPAWRAFYIIDGSYKLVKVIKVLRNIRQYIIVDEQTNIKYNIRFSDLKDIYTCEMYKKERIISEDMGHEEIETEDNNLEY